MEGDVRRSITASICAKKDQDGSKEIYKSHEDTFVYPIRESVFSKIDIVSSFPSTYYTTTRTVLLF